MKAVFRILALSSLACGPLVSQEVTDVTSAVVENVHVDAERKAVRFDVRNLSAKKITGFQASLRESGVRSTTVFCNGGGADMLDWSDPMPGTQIYVNMRRSWIEPNATLASERYLLRCVDLIDSPQKAFIQLMAITFEDGTGEGSAFLLNAFYLNRKAILDERLVWLARFVSLKSSTNLAKDAGRLYRDLTDAKYRAESDVTALGSNAAIRNSLSKLQDTDRQLVLYAQGHPMLEPHSVAAWLITDLEERTEHLKSGLGEMIESATQDQRH